jgi:hypothetical protein
MGLPLRQSQLVTHVYFSNSTEELGNWTDSIDLVNALLAFVTLSLDPVSIEICEETVEVVGASCVSIPLACVVAQQLHVL